MLQKDRRDSFFNVFNIQIVNLVVGELRACINSHYGELFEFIERHEAISQQSTDESVFCP